MANQATLKLVIEHLAQVAKTEANRMDVHALSLVLTKSVFGEEEEVTLESTAQAAQDIVLECLINEHVFIFDGCPVESVSNANRSRSGSVAMHHGSSVGRSPRNSTQFSRTTSPTSGYVSPPPSSLRPRPTSMGPISPTSLPPPRMPAAADSVFDLYKQATNSSLGASDPPLAAAAGRHISSENLRADFVE